MDRFNSEIEETPPGIERCIECSHELFEGDYVYEFEEGAAICDDCVLEHVNKWYRRTL